MSHHYDVAALRRAYQRTISKVIRSVANEPEVILALDAILGARAEVIAARLELLNSGVSLDACNQATFILLTQMLATHLHDMGKEDEEAAEAYTGHILACALRQLSKPPTMTFRPEVGGHA